MALLNNVAIPDSHNRSQVRGYPTVILVDGKMMYEYAGGRDLDSFVEFANGGYKSASGKNLPWEQTFADKAFEFLGEYSQKGRIFADDFITRTAQIPFYNNINIRLRGSSVQHSSNIFSQLHIFFQQRQKLKHSPQSNKCTPSSRRFCR